MLHGEAALLSAPFVNLRVGAARLYCVCVRFVLFLLVVWCERHPLDRTDGM